MGWSIGYDENWGRDIGYTVPSICDHPNCNEEIDRGLGYVCGSDPYGGEHGCGLYFCRDHLLWAEDDKDNKDLCFRCYGNDEPFTPKPDTEEWINHKMTHESWAEWRKNAKTL